MPLYGGAAPMEKGSVRIGVLAAIVTLFFGLTAPRGTLGWLIRQPITLASELLGRTHPQLAPALILNPVGSPFASVEAENAGGTQLSVKSGERVAPIPSQPVSPGRQPENPGPENPLPLPESPVPLPVPLPESPVPLPESPVPIPGAPDLPGQGNDPGTLEVPGLPDPADSPGLPELPSLPAF